MKSIIQKIIHCPINHAKFLNTLSLLEYIGARKILKSQQQENITEIMLAHAAEELRHAKILKKAALHIAPGICTTYQEHELLCGKHATRYFQNIDRSVQCHLKNDNSLQAYLYTTYLIEKRAISFYKLFDSVLLQLNKPTYFRGILVEEHQHLNEIIYYLNEMNCFSKHLNALIKLEQLEFENFMIIVENTL